LLASILTAFTFILAQDDTGGGDGGGGLSAGNYTLIIYIVLFIGIFYFLLIRPGQKQRKQHQELVEAVRKGDEVMTAGGIYGTVTQLKDEYLMVEIAKKTEIKVSRNSIAKRISVEAEVGEAEEAPEPPEAPEE
jgi:preprotein translocase subunit YajC